MHFREYGKTNALSMGATGSISTTMSIMDSGASAEDPNQTINLYKTKSLSAPRK
jgi:hypothetical protein